MKTLKILFLLTIGSCFSQYTIAQSTCIDSSLINPNTICFQVFDPVCGCDNITYDNSCVALNFHGVTSWTLGPCGTSSSCQAGFQIGGNNCSPEFFAYGADSYEWSFGDGSGNLGANTIHTYAIDGTYEVCLYAYDIQGVICDTVCQSITVIGCGGSSGACTADFIFSDSTCTVEFSGSGADSYFWDFGDATQGIQGVNVSHTYSLNGLYTVCMYAYNVQGQICDTVCQSITVIGCGGSSGACTADFIFSDSTCTVEFSGSGADSYFWDFGDATQGIQGVNVSHTYSLNGLYTVCMYAYNVQGQICDTVCQSITVVGCEGEPPCNAGFQYSLDSNCTYTFYGYGAASYEWWYDDTVFSGETISFYISPNSNQSLCMYAFDNQGMLCDTICETIICNMTGVDDGPVKNAQLLVYPNPSNNGFFTFETDSQITEVILLDLSGRKTNAIIDIDLGTINGLNLENGRYLLRVLSDDAIQFKQVLILK